MRQRGVGQFAPLLLPPPFCSIEIYGFQRVPEERKIVDVLRFSLGFSKQDQAKKTGLGLQSLHPRTIRLWGPKGPQDLSGMFSRGASLAIAHRESFAVIPCVSLVLFGHTNHNVRCHTNSQREFGLF